MSRITFVLPLAGFVLCYASIGVAQTIRAEFGLIERVNERLELTEGRRQIPWKKGVCEPWFGVYLSFSSSQEHRVRFRVYRERRRPGRYSVIQEDPIWRVKEGAVLSAGDIDYKPGKYRFTVAIDDGEPIVFDFEVVEFSERSEVSAVSSCPGQPSN
jgi:hypothetical protein